MKVRCEMLLIIFIMATFFLVVGCVGGSWGPEPHRPLFVSGFYLFVVVDIIILGLMVFNGGKL